LVTAPEKLGERVPDEKTNPVKAGGAASAGVVKIPIKNSDAEISEKSFIDEDLTLKPPINQ
jgi:hypothetical protein